ncbi:MAG: hypothetical protein Q8N18_01070 [Opitutaceae bacterium]|nr:hypothetical protein [Opitutaceae bacterium]
MFNVAPVCSRFRRLRAAAVLAMGAWTLAAPGFAAAPAAVVVAVQPTSVADLIVLGGGFDAGLRQGMVCRVTRGSSEIAEILLVDLRPSCSTALIVSVVPHQSIRAGDVASTKLIKT